jgi:hypothetical protein
VIVKASASSSMTKTLTPERTLGFSLFIHASLGGV